MKFAFLLSVVMSLLLLEPTISKVIELKCDPNFDTSLVHYLPYTCIVGFSCFYENIQADENTNIIINFDETNYSLDCIGFINTTLNELPSNLFNKYQAVTSVYASYMGLTSLPKNTFENASRLLEIHISGNTIKTLEDNVFSHCKHLKKVVASKNTLTTIEMNAFEGLEDLTEIDLSDNELTNIPHKTFGQLKNLKTLDLKNNSLALKFGLFPNSLVSLDLSYNKLENFTLKSIISLGNLKALYLNGNRIFRFRQFIFPDGILGPLKSLKYLQLSDNEFYCTTLADIVIWLEKHHIFIQVENHFLIINSSNIRGVGCKEEQRFFL